MGVPQVGWYGFNGGSAIAAGSGAAYAALSTQISAATAALVWMLQDIAETGKASLVGICTGSIAGLAAITPASGFTGPLGALCMGVLSAVVCRFFSTTIKVSWPLPVPFDSLLQLSAPATAPWFGLKLRASQPASSNA